MKILSPKLRETEGGLLLFHCPGCKDFHSVNLEASAHYWNGSADRPTFAPGIKIETGHYAKAERGSKPAGCWCDYYKRHPKETVVHRCVQCHSFIFNGQIRFESDCSHELGGLTVDLPDWPLEDV